VKTVRINQAHIGKLCAAVAHIEDELGDEGALSDDELTEPRIHLSELRAWIDGWLEAPTEESSETIGVGTLDAAWTSCWRIEGLKASTKRAGTAVSASASLAQRAQILEALSDIIDYLHDDELRDYEASHEAGHIYLDVRTLMEFLTALGLGRYVIVEREVLRRISELGDDADTLLAVYPFRQHMASQPSEK
jgi:hypothetical protein